MKNSITLLLTVMVLASCSSPKYTYYFSHQTNKVAKQSVAPGAIEAISVDPQLLVASTTEAPVIFSESPTSSQTVGKAYFQMNKTERKMLRHQLKKDIKTYLNAKKKTDSVNGSKASGMDHDLKLAAIFGAVGIVGMLFSNTVIFTIGAILLLIGVYFFVKWIIRQ